MITSLLVELDGFIYLLKAAENKDQLHHHSNAWYKQKKDTSEANWNICRILSEEILYGESATATVIHQSMFLLDSCVEKMSHLQL